MEEIVALNPVEKAQDKHRSFLKETPLGVPGSADWLLGRGWGLGL